MQEQETTIVSEEQREGSVASEEQREGSVASDQFLVQVGTLPVVHSAVGRLLEMYARTKDYSRLIKFTCETAELGMYAAVRTSKPILTRLPVDGLNSVACHQLDNLTKSYPVLVKPTDEVLADTYSLYETTLKPTVDRVSSIKDTGVNRVAAVGQFGVDKVKGVTNYTKDVVVGAKKFGLDRMKTVQDNSVKTLTYVLATSYGKVLSSRIDNLVLVTDGYVEKYLPAAKDEVVNLDSAPDTLYRVGRLSGKVGHRMLTRANNQVTSYRQWTEDTLANLGITKSNLEAARSLALSQAASLGEETHLIWVEMQKPGGSKVVGELLLGKMNAAEARLCFILAEIIRSDVVHSDCDKPVDINKFERQLISTARCMILNLKNYLANVCAHASSISSAVQEHIKEAGSVTNVVVNLFANTILTLKDLPRMATGKARLQFLRLTDSVTGTRTWILSHLKASEKEIVESSAEEPEAFEMEVVDESSTEKEVVDESSTEKEVVDESSTEKEVVDESSTEKEVVDESTAEELPKE